MDTQIQLSNSKEHIKILYNSVLKMKEIAERMVQRAVGFASDMAQFGRELRWDVVQCIYLFVCLFIYLFFYFFIFIM